MHIDSQHSVTLHAPGRLHLGFLDPSGSLGRRYGSIGLVIEGYDTRVELSAALADRVTADTPEGDAQMERASACLRLLRQRSGRADTLHLRLLEVPPAHAGFGSGTQLALAIGRAYAQWHGLDVPTATLAHWLGRGARSSIGIHGFEQGGLLVDGGPGADGRSAPLLSRVVLPAAWRVAVLQDERQHGLAGDAERGALAVLDPLAAPRAAEICHEVLMRVLPGAASGEFEPFALGLSRVQQVLGEYFAPVQHGRAYTSAAVGRVMDWIAGSGRRAAIGQSSWGPTAFAIVESQAHAEALVGAVDAAGLLEPGLAWRIVAPRRSGAEIADLRAPRQARRG